MPLRILIFIVSLLAISCASKKNLEQSPMSSLEADQVGEPVDLAGHWRVKVVTPVGIHYPEMTLAQEENIASGDLSGNPVEMYIYGDSVSFSSFRKTPLGKFNFDYTGKLVQQDSLEGTFKMRGGPFANKYYDWGARRLGH